MKLFSMSGKESVSECVDVWICESEGGLSDDSSNEGSEMDYSEFWVSAHNRARNKGEYNFRGSRLSVPSHLRIGK